MKQICVLIATLLAGCIENPVASMDGYVAALDAQLKAFRGQPFSAATAALGYPSGKLTVEAMTVYSWSIDRMAQIYETPVEFVCTVKVVVSAEQKIIDVQRTGNRGGCSDFARSIGLKPLEQ